MNSVVCVALARDVSRYPLRNTKNGCVIFHDGITWLEQCASCQEKIGVTEDVIKTK